MTITDDLREYCDFEDENVYVLMAIARKNENPVTSSEEIIWRESIRNETDIERKVRKLRAAAEGYDPPDFDDPTFRLYVTANPRDPVHAYFEFKARQEHWLEGMFYGDEQMYEKIRNMDSQWVSELQRPHSRAEKYLQIDVDQKFTTVEGQAFEDFLREATRGEIHCKRETPNGWHFVVDSYNYVDNYMEDIDYEVHSDGLLFLEYLTEPQDG